MKKQSNAMRIKDAARVEEGTGISEDMAGGMKVGGGRADKRLFQAQACEKNGYSNSRHTCWHDAAALEYDAVAFEGALQHVLQR